MSTWHNITVESDIEVNNSDDTLEIYIGDDYGGAIYVSVPMEYVRNLAELDEEISSLKAQIEELKSEILVIRSRHD